MRGSGDSHWWRPATSYSVRAHYATVTALTVADKPPVRALFSIPWQRYFRCSGCPATSAAVTSVNVAVCEIPICTQPHTEWRFMAGFYTTVFQLAPGSTFDPHEFRVRQSSLIEGGTVGGGKPPLHAGCAFLLRNAATAARPSLPLS